MMTNVHRGPRPASTASSTMIEHVPGELFDRRYRLIALLGAGGMGTVWRAHCLALDVDVAIKLIHAGERASRRSSVDRLLNEARAMARLEHPSIRRILEMGETVYDEPFLVLELLNGEPLSAVVRGGSVAETYAVQVLLPIASALACAHALGIVHRDIKPDNIILLPANAAGERLPKLIDFGVARFTDAASGRRLTIVGEQVGSPAYMAPEQVRGSMDVDARADVWALSVVLYKLITGRAPFAGPDRASTLSAILEREPLPPPARLGVDPELWAIIMRGIAKDRWMRWQTMEELGEALASWAAGRGVTRDCTGSPLAAHWLRGRAEPFDDAIRAGRVTVIPSAPGVAAGLTDTVRVIGVEPHIETPPVAGNVTDRHPPRLAFLSTIASWWSR